MAKKVLFIDSVHPALQERLEENGFECHLAYSLSRQEVLDCIDQYFGVVIRSRIRMDEHLLSRATNLKFIARSGAGMENIDISFAEKRGITCFNAPEGNRDAVGEHAIGMILSLFNNLKKGDEEVRQGIWKREENRGVELGGKTVGIIGFGNNGKAFAQKLSGFGCTVLAYDKYAPPQESSIASPVSLEQIWEQAEVISFHVPLTEETHYYFDEDFLENCHRPIYLLNMARGKCVKTDTLVDGLKSGKVLGACLDVLEYEKFSFERLQSKDLPDAFRELIESDKVVLSPHVAGWTHESHKRLSTVLAEKILSEFGQ
ncbi:NAD(P)-dependent oxidoreductase [Halocola ammonii]